MYNTITKTIAAWAFNHYIAYYYFDNVNVSQLKVAFEKGEVELENLPIKKDALEHFNLSMEVISGIVGKLSIKVPLMTLLTEPWVIKISNLMLVVAPRRQSTSDDESSISIPKKTSDESLIQNMNDQSRLDLLQENLSESFDGSLIENEDNNDNVTSEETKLAEFYSSFSATMSAIVKDIYKNIRLEIESMTIIFEEFDHGLVKFNVDNLLLHRPNTSRNMLMDNVSIYLAGVGLPNVSKGDDLLRVDLEHCNLDIYDEASNSMQLVVQPQENSSTSTNSCSSSSSSNPSKRLPAIASEIKIEGNLGRVSIELLTKMETKDYKRTSPTEPILLNDIAKEGVFLSKRNILKCDMIKIEFKLNNNAEDELIRSFEKNLHIKLDLIGMQYIHSQRIYEITTQRLMNLLKFFVKLQTKKHTDQKSYTLARRARENGPSVEKREETSFNKLLIINIVEGLLYVVDDTSQSCAVPLLEFSLEDCRILQFSGKFQHNGFVFAKMGCNYYNRENSTWSNLLQPWPFSLTWDLKSTDSLFQNRNYRLQNRQITLNSDEIANFTLSGALLDLCDVALNRTIHDFINPKLWPIATRLNSVGHNLSQSFDSIFLLHNETGYKLHFAPLEHYNDLYEISDTSRCSPTFGIGGDSVTNSLHKISIHSRSSNESRDSPDLNCLARWISVDVGETVSFQYETFPIYRRHISDPIPKSRIILVRVEGWKTLTPISIDKPGLFFREAYSDRAMNEDTYIVVSIDLEEKSARKVISIRSPLNLVNLLESTLEVHFAESKQALYIKPNGNLAVPLPYLFDRIHIRACNVGVTMSDKALLWDDIKQVSDSECKTLICYPISITDLKHASYCPSQPFRIRVSTQCLGSKYLDENQEEALYPPMPIFSITFAPTLTIVNLLPLKLQYIIGNIEGALNRGSQQKIHHVDTSRPTEVNFKINGFPRSKPVYIEPGATGSFQQTLELIDKKDRSLYLTAEIIPASSVEDPAVQVVISAPFWFINKTRMPLVFKQEGALLEAAGQFFENEENPVPTLLFSFYDNSTDLAPPFLCRMRLGKSNGVPMWCDGSKLEKGSGERRLCIIPSNNKDGDSTMNKFLIDINIGRGFGRYSETNIVTFTARDEFDPLTKIPKKTTAASPHNYKLTSYNHNTNLAERIAGQAVSLFSSQQNRGKSAINLTLPGVKLTLVDKSQEKFIEASIDNIDVNCTTNSKEQILECSLQDIRIDSVLADCEKGSVLDRVATLDESINVRPALRLIMDRMLGNSFGTTLFKRVQLSLCELALNFEDKLVPKLVEFIGFRNRRARKNLNSLERDLDRILHPEDDRRSKYYFGLLRIDLSGLKLCEGVLNYMGLKFLKVEDVQLQFASYCKMNISQTVRGVFESVMRFYTGQWTGQKTRIAGQLIQNYFQRFHLSDLLSTLYDEVYHKFFN